MNKQTLLIAGIIFAAALLALGVLLVLPPPPSAKPLSETEKPEPATAASSLGSGSSLVGTAKTKTVEPLAAATPSSSAAAPASALPLTSKEAILVEIDDAIVTYAPEGVALIGPHVSSNDPDIRAAAIEGLKQLDEPEGAKLLRRLAQKATNLRDRSELIEAAQFIELPPIRFEPVQP
jgi:hypothetical protein